MFLRHVGARVLPPVVREMRLYRINKDKSISEIQIQPNPDVLDLVKRCLVERILGKVSSRQTRSYEMEVENNESRDIICKILAGEDSFDVLTTRLAQRYAQQKRSRTALLLMLTFEDGSEYYFAFFKFPPQPTIGIVSGQARYLKESLRKYQKAFVYPNPARQDEVKISQEDSFSDYLPTFLKVKKSLTPEEELLEYWKKNKRLTFEDLTRLIESRPSLRNARIRVTIGSHRLQLSAGELKDTLASLQSIVCALLEGDQVILTIKGPAKIEVDQSSLASVYELLQRRERTS